MMEPSAAKALRYRWLLFSLLALGYILVYFHRICPAVLAVDLMRDLEAGGSLAGMLGAAYFYPYAAMQLPAGLLADSWGPRRTISVFFLLAAAGAVLLGLAPTIRWAIAGRALVGAGVAMLFVSTLKILVDDIRKKISPNKCSASEWLDVMRTAHHLGLRTTATMMFGHIEKPRHIVEHLIKIRDLQNETGGFTAFIPWTFQPQHTRIDVKTATAVEYLRILALSRIVLDNIANIQASWVTQGDKIAQTALFFGANDFGSTMIEENVVAAAGVSFRLPETEIIRLIRDAGFIPVQRDCFYHPVKELNSA